MTISSEYGRCGDEFPTTEAILEFDIQSSNGFQFTR